MAIVYCILCLQQPCTKNSSGTGTCRHLRQEAAGVLAREHLRDAAVVALHT